MTTNELMRHLLTDIPEEDQRHLVEVVDRNHAEQLARKRRAAKESELRSTGYGAEDSSYDDADPWESEAL